MLNGEYKYKILKCTIFSLFNHWSMYILHWVKVLCQWFKFAYAGKRRGWNVIGEGILNKKDRSRYIKENEKAKFVKMLAANVETVDKAQRLKRDHRTI